MVLENTEKYSVVISGELLFLYFYFDILGT